MHLYCIKVINMISYDKHYDKHKNARNY